MLKIGTFIGDRYEILEQVGSGGMSDVYKAKCHKLNRYVAIKVLKKEFIEDRNFVSKFRVEAQSAAGLSHPNIVSVYDVGEDNGLYYIVMEMIDGITLKNYIRRKGKLSIREATSIAIQVAQGIECAHNNHIIHRDIKPQNILISRDGKVKVTDFGIARAASANTINSNAMGSVHYISPEQARGGYIDERSDIYSLGVTMYEMITGKVPFDGDSTVTIALQHIQGEMPDVADEIPDVPISIRKIVYKCTQKKPDRRYLKISSLITDLKKSLITPDEDFVKILPMAEQGETVMFDPNEIKSAAMNSNNDNDDNVLPMDDDSEDEEIREDEDDEYITEDDEDDEFYDDEDDIDRINPKLDRLIHVGVIIAGIIFALIVGMVAIRLVKSGGEKQTTEQVAGETLAADQVKMPDLAGMTKVEAEATLKEYELGKQFTEVDNDVVEEGKVCEQSVIPGTAVAKHTTIIVSISKGPKTFQLMDYKGKTLDDVQKTVEKLGLKVGETKYEFSDSVDTNCVVSTSPKAGEVVKTGDTITFTVSKGKEYDPDAVTPYIIDTKETDAKNLLIQAGMGLGNVTYVYDDNIEKGFVISQSHASGERLPKGTLVDIVVSNGPAKVEVPDLTGLTKSKASEALESISLHMGKVTEEYSEEKKGTVIDQSFGEGTKLDVDSYVDIVISKGEEPTTEPETTTKRMYESSFSVNRSDIDDDGAVVSGRVTITVNGKAIDLPTEYQDISTWPTESFDYTITAEAGGTAQVKAYVEGATVAWLYNAELK